jgi:uncharacterized membrane protein HdeD (DUF308 family)
VAAEPDGKQATMGLRLPDDRLEGEQMQPQETSTWQAPPDGRPDTAWQGTLLARTWQAALCAGILTLALGLVVTFHPTGSLNVIAILLGVLMVISGIFHLIRVFDGSEPHRVWLGIAGLAFIVLGVVLIRHLHLTLSVIGLIIGIAWIVQGVSAVIAGLSGGSREGRGWWIFFGLVSLIAGIVVTSAPVSSLAVLAVLTGMWFVIMGLFEIVGAYLLHRAVGRPRPAVVGIHGGPPAGG